MAGGLAAREDAKRAILANWLYTDLYPLPKSIEVQEVKYLNIIS